MELNTDLEKSLEKIETVTSSGAPVSERITHILAARGLLRRGKRSLEEGGEFQRRARIKGMIDGNPPYDQKRLQELGLGYMTNVNFLEMRAILDFKASAFHELFYEVPSLIDVKQLDGVDPRLPNPGYDGIIAEEFSRTVMNWTGFIPTMDRCRRESDAFGLGILFWPDEFDWRPKVFSLSAFTTDPTAKLDIEDLSYFFIDDQMTVGDLLRYIQNEDAASKAGWDVKQVRDLLVRIFYKESDSGNTLDRAINPNQWEALQQRVRNNDWSVQEREFEGVSVHHLLIQEVDGSGVSHYIFADSETVADDFLFRKKARFERMSQVLWWLPYNNGDGFLRSVRGMASMIENHCDLSNRFLGRVFDAGFTTASLILQPRTAADLSKLQLIRMGVITTIPAEMTPIQTSFQPQLAPLVQLRDLSSAIMKNNTGVWRANPELFAERQPEKTARQVAEEVGREQRMEKATIAYDYTYLDRLYREMFRRMMAPAYRTSSADRGGKREAAEMYDRMIRRGIPEEILTQPEVFEINATRAVGLGSLGLRLDVSQQIFSMRGVFDESGQINATRDFIAARVGQRNVDRYKPVLNRDSIPSSEKSFARLENNDLIKGQEVIVGSDQLHAVHFVEHAAPISEVINAVSQGAAEQLDIPATVQMLSVALPHCEEHLRYLALDPARDQLVKQGGQFLKVALSLYQGLQQTLQKQIEAQQEAQAAQQQVVSDAEQVVASREDIEGRRKHELKLYEAGLKAESLNQARREKTAEQLAIRREGSAAAIQLAAENQRAQQALEAEKVRAEIALKAEKVRAEAALAASRARG